MSSLSSESKGSTEIPSSRACSSVATEVATQRISLSRRAAIAGSRCATVEPVPSPTAMPSSTSSAAASAASFFSESRLASDTRGDTSRRIVEVAATAEQQTDIDELCINTIRTLSMDAIQKANSGHPGTPMALAPLAYTLWQHYLRFGPEDPIWPNRDRFVLSVGHASMLLYSLLHLARVKAVDPDYETLGELSVKLSDIEHFRQLDSRAAGHPEYRWTSGVETTTGPLGQGVATSVGMAIASKSLSATYNCPGFELFDWNVYVIASDGDMMEGVSYEGASLAGHLGLANLCWIYDNNRITIDGSPDLAFSDDVASRFMAQGWNVTRVGDANDADMLRRALESFESTDDRPTLIIVDSHIGYGAPKVQDTAAAHGEPLGDEVAREA